MRFLAVILTCFSLAFAVTDNASVVSLSAGVTPTAITDVVMISPSVVLVSENIITTQSQQLVTVVTSQGKFICEMYPSDAPKTVENFLKLSKDGFYNGLKFHRVIPGFVAQGGDPLTKGKQDVDWTVNPRLAYSQGMPLAGTGGPGYKVKAEFNNRKHETGALAMARSQDPDSAGSQFYICLAPQPHLDGNYTVFGKVTDGMDVVLKLKVGDTIQSISVYPVLPTVVSTNNLVSANVQ